MMDYKAIPLDYKATFSRYTYLLNLIGLEFYNGPDISNRAKIRLFIFNIIFIPFACGQFFLLFKMTSDNFLEGAQIVPICLMFVLNVIKMTMVLVKKSEFTQVFTEIGELWPRGLHQNHEKTVVMNKWTRRIGSLLNAFFIYAVVNLALFEVIPLMVTSHSVFSDPGVTEYVFPFRDIGLWHVNSTASYVVTYVWQLAATVPCQLCLYLPFDIIIVVLTCNVSILLRLLQIDLETCLTPRKGQDKDIVRMADSVGFHSMISIVMQHQKLLRVANRLNSIFGLVIFIHVGFASVEICFFGFLTVVFGGVAETVANLLTVFNAIITIFLIALSGQLLSDTSSSIAAAAYSSIWYCSDTPVQILVRFIIVRSQKPSYLSALGFSNMTLESFSKIMSTAWTYFSLLIQFYEQT